MFKFPADESRKELWLSKIPRTITISKQSVVCERHFVPRFIVRFDTGVIDGVVVSEKRQIPKLTGDAYPSYFRTAPRKRKCANKRREEIEQRDEDAMATWAASDAIADFAAFSEKVKGHLCAPWITRFTKTDSQDYYSIEDSYNEKTMPSLVAAVKVFADMHLEIYTKGTGKFNQVFQLANKVWEMSVFEKQREGEDDVSGV